MRRVALAEASPSEREQPLGTDHADPGRRRVRAAPATVESEILDPEAKQALRPHEPQDHRLVLVGLPADDHTAGVSVRGPAWHGPQHPKKPGGEQSETLATTSLRAILHLARPSFKGTMVPTGLPFRCGNARDARFHGRWTSPALADTSVRSFRRSF